MQFSANISVCCTVYSKINAVNLYIFHQLYLRQKKWDFDCTEACLSPEWCVWNKEVEGFQVIFLVLSNSVLFSFLKLQKVFKPNSPEAKERCFLASFSPLVCEKKDNPFVKENANSTMSCSS